MSHTVMIGYLQIFFDGHILSPHDVTYCTGEPEATAIEIYEAIKKLRSLTFEQIEDKQ